MYTCICTSYCVNYTYTYIHICMLYTYIYIYIHTHTVHIPATRKGFDSDTQGAFN